MELVIFDLDGTLVDTLKDLQNCMNVVLQRHDFPPRTLEEIKSFVGNGIKKLTQRAVPQGTPTEITEICYEEMVGYYSLHALDFTAPYGGIFDLLTDLHSKNKKVAVVTNKVQKSAESICSKFFDGLIDMVVGDDKKTPLKPAPDNVFKAIELMGVDKNQVVYVGDSEVDALTARNAEIPFVGVSWGFRGRAVLNESGAEKIADYPQELKSFLLP